MILVLSWTVRSAKEVDMKQQNNWRTMTLSFSPEMNWIVNSFCIRFCMAPHFTSHPEGSRFHLQLQLCMSIKRS